MDAEPPLEPVGARRRFGLGAVVVAVLVALAVTVVIGLVRSASAPLEDVPLQTASPGAPLSGADLYVHVSGAVMTPGLYVLPADARVVDAIAAAGGFADGADEAAVNLARRVADGEQLQVPLQGAEGVAGAAAPPGDGLIDLNTADEALLDTLPRVGPTMAARIIDWREKNGRFTSVDDLLAVPGIGQKMLDGLRDLVTV